MTIPKNVKCDCGHTAKYHHLSEGQCHSTIGKPCACTWFHPNHKYVAKKK